MEALERRVVGQRGGQGGPGLRLPHPPGPPQDPSLRAQPHLLLVGPTRAGRAHLVRTLADHLGLPTVPRQRHLPHPGGLRGGRRGDPPGPPPPGRRGQPELAEVGVIFLDEFDKLARKSGEHRAEGRDVSGEGVQRALLRMVEGAVVPVPQNLSGPARYRGEGRREVLLDTSRILWIFTRELRRASEEVVPLRLPRTWASPPRAAGEPLPPTRTWCATASSPSWWGGSARWCSSPPSRGEELARILEGPEGLLAGTAPSSRASASPCAWGGLPRLLARRASTHGLRGPGPQGPPRPPGAQKAHGGHAAGGGEVHLLAEDLAEEGALP